MPGLAGLHRSGAGSQALSWPARAASWQQLPLTSAAPGRALAAAPAHGAPPGHPDATGKGSAFPPMCSGFLRAPLTPKFRAFIQILRFLQWGDTERPGRCACAKLLCSLQLLTRLAPAEGFNKLPEYLFWGIFGALVWGTGVLGGRGI